MAARLLSFLSLEMLGDKSQYLVFDHPRHRGGGNPLGHGAPGPLIPPAAQTEGRLVLKRWWRSGAPATISKGSTSRVTTELAPTTEFSPMVMPGPM